MGKLTISMAIFNSHVSLPEGKQYISSMIFVMSGSRYDMVHPSGSTSTRAMEFWPKKSCNAQEAMAVAHVQ